MTGPMRWATQANWTKVRQQNAQAIIGFHGGSPHTKGKPRQRRKQKIIPLDEVARRLKHDRGISTAAPEVSVPRACDYLVLTSDEIVGANPADNAYPALHHHGN